MAREGTRSSTGNSKPRVFQPVDTAPTFKRSRKSKTAGLLGGKADKTAAAPAAVPAPAPAPAGAATTEKKKGPAKKAGALVTKAKNAVKKVEKKVTGAAKAPKKQAAAAST